MTTLRDRLIVSPDPCPECGGATYRPGPLSPDIRKRIENTPYLMDWADERMLHRACLVCGWTVKEKAP